MTAQAEVTALLGRVQRDAVHRMCARCWRKGTRGFTLVPARWPDENGTYIPGFVICSNFRACDKRFAKSCAPARAEFKRREREAGRG